MSQYPEFIKVVQYTSIQCQEMTEEFIRGYSRKGIPWVYLESFHALIKREWLKFYKIRNYEKAYRLVFEYIERFYNMSRIYAHCECH